MKRFAAILLAVLTLSGCATYRFQTGQPPYNKGYVVERSGQPIVDYTVGKNNTVPSDLKLAVERFYRRRDTVEAYYKKMGEMEGRFKEVFLNPPIAIVQFIGGFFHLPYLYYSNYKYEHDPKYRKEVDKEQNERLAAELARKKAVRDELNAYIEKDLAKEPVLAKEPEVVETKVEEVKVALAEGEKTTVVKEEIEEPKASTEANLDVNASVVTEAKPAEVEKSVVEPVVEEKVTAVPVVQAEKIVTEPAKEPVAGPAQEEIIVTESTPAEKITTEPALTEKATAEPAMVEKVETSPQVVEKPEPVLEVTVRKVEAPKITKEKVKPQAQPPVAIIIAKPAKGYSPLRVKFYGHKSHSRGSRIIAYQWDFGDGTTSNKKDFVNTYWSVSYGSRNFPVTLTVTDNRGNTATATTVIEVKSK
ncbi:MAG: PKD domain-containing protein [Candidatus Omnitrophica bacterium]|nr:PKD domain-containing protein [Candidatus Omnitrophota bacterium]